jgi:hypothetical protein
MATHTRRRINCQCGHEGFQTLSENDSSFSRVWERYGLDGFSGNGFTITSYADMPDDILAAMKPTCPKCGETNNVRYAKGS